MILLALAMAASAPEAVEGWTVGRQGNPARITASRRLENGAELEYQIGVETVRSFGIFFWRLPACGADRGFETPPGDAAARHDAVYDKLFETLKSVSEKCGMDQETGDALLAGFDDAYAAAERLASARDAAAPAGPTADRTQEVAGWKLADVTEMGERKLRMRRSFGEGDLEYSVMAGLGRRMDLGVGGCGSTAMLDLAQAEAGRLTGVKAELHTLIKDFAQRCKLAPSAQTGLIAGFDQAFAAIEDWNRQSPVPGY